MPVYNAEPFLDDAILSVMEQSFGDWELICVNDGSTDGSLSKLEAYASKDPRIRVFSKPNGGALNARVRQACSKWLYPTSYMAGCNKKICCIAYEGRTVISRMENV